MAESEKTKREESSEFVQHVRAAGKALLRQWKSLIPGDFWTYGREARRETLLAMRSAVDTMIDRLESEEDEAPKPRPARKAKVEVE
jgi:hypothetical protein